MNYPSSPLPPKPCSLHPLTDVDLILFLSIITFFIVSLYKTQNFLYIYIYIQLLLTLYTNQQHHRTLYSSGSLSPLLFFLPPTNPFRSRKVCYTFVKSRLKSSTNSFSAFLQFYLSLFVYTPTFFLFSVAVYFFYKKKKKHIIYIIHMSLFSSKFNFYYFILLISFFYC